MRFPRELLNAVGESITTRNAEWPSDVVYTGLELRYVKVAS